MPRLSIVLLAAAAGCAQPPTKEIEMTADRVARAQAVEADVYAKKSYEAAETALGEARQLVTERDYGAAVQAASLASTRADEAYTRALLGKQRMTRLARRQLLEIASLVEETRSWGVPAKETESLEALTDRLGVLERELERGAAASVYQEGTRLKNDALDFLNRLKAGKGNERRVT
jgi:hypothetical protein